jgi:hypothetical protein
LKNTKTQFLSGALVFPVFRLNLNASIQSFRSPAFAFVWSLAYQKLASPLQSPRVMKSRLGMRLEYMRQGNSYPVYLYDVLRMTKGLVCEPS